MEFEELKQRAEQGDESAFRQLDSWRNRLTKHSPKRQGIFSEKEIDQFYIELSNCGNVHA